MIERSALVQELHKKFVRTPLEAYDRSGDEIPGFFMDRTEEEIELSKESCMLGPLNAEEHNPRLLIVDEEDPEDAYSRPKGPRWRE